MTADEFVIGQMGGARKTLVTRDQVENLHRMLGISVTMEVLIETLRSLDVEVFE